MKTDPTNNYIYTLLDSDLFIQWILSPTPETDLYWAEEMGKDGELADNIRIIKLIIENTNVKEPAKLSIEEKASIWDEIQKNTITKERKTKHRISLRFAAVAATIALIAGGYWLVTALDENVNNIDYSTILANDEQEIQTGDISLKLSNNSTISIKSDSSTMVYDNKGALNIDSKPVEETQTAVSVLNQLTVPHGKTTSLILSDGTRIWVNSGSKVIYPSVFDKQKREIFVSGEIFLDVTKNEACPFIIKTLQMDVKVLGTKLNISAYDNEEAQSVVLVTGAVSVNNKVSKSAYKMKPNEMFTFNESLQRTEIKTVDVSYYTTWIDGYMLLKSESLDKVLLRLERYNNMSYTYNADELKNIRVSGKLELKDDIEKILKYISTTAPISYQIDGNNVSIKRKI